MSLRRRFQSHYRNLSYALQTFQLPAWVYSSAMRATLLGVLVFFSMAYLVKTSALSESGYKINALEKQVAVLQEDLQKTKVEMADYSSLKNIQQRAGGSGMVAMAGIRYFKAAGQVVAVK